MRPLSDAEMQFLTFVLSQPLRGSAELLAQLPFTSAAQRDACGCPSLTLSVDRGRAARASIRGRVHFEARGRLTDGSPIDVIVHHHDGYLDELEFVAYTHTEQFAFEIPATRFVELFGWDEDDPEAFGFRSRFR